MKKPLIIIPITLIIIIVALISYKSCYNNKFIENYFRNTYKPTDLIIQETEKIPEEYHIQGIPWISYKKNICQTASFQMITSKNGIEKPKDYFTFLLGYTYGAVYIKGAGQFMSFGDPEPGFFLAATEVGLERKYFITNNKEHFINALRYYLSQDYPVRIAWNSARSLKYAVDFGYFQPPEGWKEPSKKAFSPHSVVFAGFNQAGFYYYETQGKDQFVKDEKGIKVPDQIVIEAVESFSSRFKLPWKYMFMIFIKGERKEDLVDIWERNGNEMIGYQFGPTSTGSLAIEELANGVEIEGIKIGSETLRKYFIGTINELYETRFDNAIFLELYFRDDIEVQNAVKYLKSTSVYYNNILQILGKKRIDKTDVESIIDFLRSAALSEKKAGEIFIEISKR